jgi:hypothetical protein
LPARFGIAGVITFGGHGIVGFFVVWAVLKTAD